jgi:hypothetical protein
MTSAYSLWKIISLQIFLFNIKIYWFDIFYFIEYNKNIFFIFNTG